MDDAFAAASVGDGDGGKERPLSLEDFQEEPAEEECAQWIREQLAFLDASGLDDADDEKADAAIMMLHSNGPEKFGQGMFDSVMSAVMSERNG